MFAKLRTHVVGTLMVLVMGMSMSAPARAGIPVIDAANLAQQIQQVMSWVQQFKQMAQQITQLQQAYAAITGGRGMEALMPMSNLARNYLPEDYSELANVMNNASVTYSGMATQVRGIMNTHAVLSKGQVGGMTGQAQQVINLGRQSAALLETISREAQRNSSQRMNAQQQLITAIGGASDDKAIQDLQGRIAAEQAMLTADQTKLQAMYQLAQAQELQRQQMTREVSIAQIGNAASLPAVSHR
jgi:hypothetical protein